MLDNSVMSRPKEDIRERFWRYVKKNKGGGCWIWTGSRIRRGYGQFMVGRKNMKAHRVSFMIIHGNPNPQNLLVLHKCDNPPCVNPAHLFLGTAKQNVEDMFSKGRQHDRKGEKNGQSKLSSEEVLKICRLLKGGTSQSRVAALFGLNQTTVGDISRGKIWGHVTGIKRPPQHHGRRRGESHRLTSLTDKKVKKIRELSAKGKTQGYLADKFGVCPATIHNVVTRKYWGHVE